MEALSTNVSSLRAAGGSLLPAAKTPPSHRHVIPAAKPKLPPSSLSHHPLDPKPLHLSHPRSPQPLLAASSPPRHPRRSAAAGYAAALLDAAQRGGALDAVARDVRRLGLMARGGGADVVEGGVFDRRVAALVRMLAGRGKAGVVGEVVEEFGRMWDELCGAETVVVVSKEGRMGAGELAGIAREAGSASGAARVRVRHLYRGDSSMFAV